MKMFLNVLMVHNYFSDLPPIQHNIKKEIFFHGFSTLIYKTPLGM